MKKPGYKQMTEEEFNNLKLMQQAGLSTTQTAKITKRSTSTLSYIWRSGTFEDYCLRVHKKAVQQVEASDPDETIELLRSINESLKFLVEHLPVPEKRRLFK